jgi:hypothetical protein
MKGLVTVMRRPCHINVSDDSQATNSVAIAVFVAPCAPRLALISPRARISPLAVISELRIIVLVV